MLSEQSIQNDYLKLFSEQTEKNFNNPIVLFYLFVAICCSRCDSDFQAVSATFCDGNSTCPVPRAGYRWDKIPGFAVDECISSCNTSSNSRKCTENNIVAISDDDATLQNQMICAQTVDMCFMLKACQNVKSWNQLCNLDVLLFF